MARRDPSDSYGLLAIGGDPEVTPIPTMAGWRGAADACTDADAAAATAEMAAEAAAAAVGGPAVKVRPSQAAGAAGAAGAAAAAAAAAEIAAQQPVRHWLGLGLRL